MEPLVVEGRPVPRLLYGTAWKEDQTERLVSLALEAGFRGIDTANQRKHYHEAAVGAALERAYERGLVRREDLFLQTKFTSLGGQDHRLPYDANADPRTQVRQSFARSLEHLRTQGIDSYVLHGPSSRVGIGPHDRAVWSAMEDLKSEGRVGLLGVSNVSLEQLRALVDGARIRPSFVQNRCYARLGWDREVRAYCRSNALVYQGFSLLTANQAELRSATMRSIATKMHKTPAQIVFRFALEVGMQALTGTSDPAHMREDLDLDFTLSDEDVRAIELISS